MAERVLAYICALVLGTWLAATAVVAQVRHAFVVGIDRYDNLEPYAQLQRAVNDARSIGRTLEGLGYRVVVHENVERRQFNDAWQTFIDALNPGDEVAIYFSGHGIEIDGDNYLLPRDLPKVRYGRETQIRRESISLQNLLLDLREKKPRVSLVILDACRDHPLVPPEFKNVGPKGGLANIDAPEGTFIMYSAGAGETALDRLPGKDPNGVNSVYTRSLLPLLKTPGLSLPQMAIRVRREVYDLARTVPHRQRPAYYDGLIGHYCVAGCKPAEVVGAAGPGAVPPPASAVPPGPQVALRVPDAQRPAIPAPSQECAKLPTLLAQMECNFRAGLAVGSALRQQAGAAPKDQARQSCDGVSVSLGTGGTACIKPGWGKTFRDCPTCPEMVVAPAGSFMMGSPKGEPGRRSDEDQVRVTIAKPFAVGAHEVTFDEWDACVAAGGCNGYKPPDEGWGRGRRPVVNVSSNDAQAYAKWLSAKTGQSYRLLSEAEWEYAARAGTASPFWWGSSITPAQANYDGNYTYGGGGSKGAYRKATVPVDSFKPNPWGLFNVHGNVWEWTGDC